MIAYFDCQSGISGNMALGALIDVGLDINYLKKELKKIHLHEHYQILAKKVKKCGIQSTYVEVKIPGHQHAKKSKDILNLIKKSKLKKSIKEKSIGIFQHIFKAEFEVHGKEHLHDVGAVDTIIDIVGTVIGLEKLKIHKIYSSAICTGSGTIIPCHGKDHSHGIMPIPAPATAILLKNTPIYSGNLKKELTTPTGAAIITYLAETFEEIPRLKIEKIGYGAGYYDLPQANVLRILIGENPINSLEDNILQVETNIDDMDPKKYDSAIAKIMQASALDAFIEPIRMKKKRNAIKLTTLCRIDDKEKILETLFRNTTTIGTRIFLVKREILKRKIERSGKNWFKNSYLNNELLTSKVEKIKPSN